MNEIKQVHHDHRIEIKTLCHALLIPKASYYRNEKKQLFDQTGSCSRGAPKNALNDAEKQGVLDLLHTERFVDKTPYDVYYGLLGEGVYTCSVRTMYRLLEAQGENKDRRRQRAHRNDIKPELLAVRPNEVWSWDITKLRTTQKWSYLHLYVIMDVFSRCVVGWMIAERESQDLAKQLIQESALKQGIQPGQLTLHADNGASMKSHTVAQLLEYLGISKTHSRPYVSDDNPFSEALFKTYKYFPEFPGKFETLCAGETFSAKFFNWYNKEHFHSGIAWLTPESVHCGYAEALLERRHQAQMQAYKINPLRFNNKQPEKKKLPEAVYINPPQVVKIDRVKGG
jgi:putative transposase